MQIYNIKKNMKTLAIETSCDDTSIWIINFDWKVFSVDNILAYSQVKEHNEFGWVVPEIASRLHSEKIIAVLNQIWRNKIKQVDNICVTAYPWLPGSLVVWKTVAAELWEYFNKPVIQVDHIIWHIFALFLDRDMTQIEFPMIILTASWGHNNIYYVAEKNNKSIVDKWPDINEFTTKYRWNYSITQIWQTLDDAAWECFDKVSRMLWWPYPWWVRISQQASRWKPNEKFELNRIRLSHDKFEFSFSGIKSQINHLINKQKANITIPLTSCPRFDLDTEENLFTPSEIADIAYEFQESVVEVLGKKLTRAALQYNAKTIWLSWWVSANDRLREYISELLQNTQRLKNQNISSEIQNTELLVPQKKLYCTDNAAMIGVAWLLK